MSNVRPHGHFCNYSLPDCHPRQNWFWNKFFNFVICFCTRAVSAVHTYFLNKRTLLNTRAMYINFMKFLCKITKTDFKEFPTIHSYILTYLFESPVHTLFGQCTPKVMQPIHKHSGQISSKSENFCDRYQTTHRQEYKQQKLFESNVGPHWRFGKYSLSEYHNISKLILKKIMFIDRSVSLLFCVLLYMGSFRNVYPFSKQTMSFYLNFYILLESGCIHLISKNKWFILYPS